MEIASLRNSIDFFTQRQARERANLATLRRYLEAEAPDRVVIWGMWNLCRSLPKLAEELLPEHTAYYMGDYWPTLPSQWRNFWQVKPRNWLTASPKWALKAPAMYLLSREKRPELALDRVMFPSEFLRAEFARLGFKPKHAPVVHGAIDAQPYVQSPPRSLNRDTLRLLYVGRLSPEKGVHLAIEALGIVAAQDGATPMRLAIAGAGEQEYEAHLRELASHHGVESRIEFLGSKPKEELPGLYQSADVFLFTSVWPEPFGRAPVEAMASGLAVVGAPVGGAAEFLVPEETALCFQPGDAADLARQIARLARRPELRQRLARNGRQLAADRFDIARMTAGIEAFLQGLGRPPLCSHSQSDEKESEALEARSR
jgi:glycosyltransferase involved in cell wall biosynthesis